MSPKKVTKKSVKKSTPRGRATKGLSADEIAAMKETLKERKAAGSKEEMEKALLEKIAEMKGSDRAMAKRLHAIIIASAPSLTPKTWYGMPAYADKDGKIVCFFQAAAKFKARYATFGFNDPAHLDEGAMWPTSWAMKDLTAADEARVSALVKRAVG